MNENIKKIYENYFRENRELIEDREVGPDEIGEMVAAAVNDALMARPEGDPSKNKETGINMMKKIKEELQNPERISKIIEDVIKEMTQEIS